MKMIMAELKKYDAFFFDMDGTLTRSKTEIADKHIKMLLRLAFKYPVIVVSGATLGQMVKQLLISNITYLSQNGNLAVSRDGKQLWNNTLSDQEVADIDKHIARVSFMTRTPTTEEYVQHRGCQVSYSMAGHDADRDVKENYDPTRSRRGAILKAEPFVHDTLTVKIGGTTCLDYTLKSGTKGVNVKRFMEEHGIKEALYVGDALFPEGNDASVISVCDTLQVNSVDETYELINKYI